MSLRRIIGYCGACIAFYIGAGFATMQEVMQYEASYGSLFGVVILVAALIYVYTNLSFTYNGSKNKLLNGGDIYKVYCGQRIGTFYQYFSAFFCYMCFIVMCGGANSTASEQWGLPLGIGAIILALLVTTTVYFGLHNILRVLKWIGPLIIVLILIVAVITTIRDWDQLKAGLEAIDSHKYNIAQVGNGNPIASGASYGGFVILWFAAFLAELGAKGNVKEIEGGMLLSTLAIFAAAALCCFALIENIGSTWAVGVPALVLARSISPLLAHCFAVIIYLGIFTTACPLLWTGVRKVSEEKSNLYKLLTVILGSAGCIVACLIPYQGLINILYGLNGYLGFILIAFMLYRDIKNIVSK